MQDVHLNTVNSATKKKTHTKSQIKSHLLGITACTSAVIAFVGNALILLKTTNVILRK